MAPNTKLNIDFLMLSKKPKSKLKSQIDEQNPRSETTNSHGFREKERERESWVFRQLREKGLGFRSKRVGFWLRFREREKERERKLGFRP